MHIIIITFTQFIIFSSVKFPDLKLRLCKKDDKYEVWKPHTRLDSPCPETKTFQFWYFAQKPHTATHFVQHGNFSMNFAVAEIFPAIFDLVGRKKIFFKWNYGKDPCAVICTGRWEDLSTVQIPLIIPTILLLLSGALIQPQNFAKTKEKAKSEVHFRILSCVHFQGSK